MNLKKLKTWGITLLLFLVVTAFVSYRRNRPSFDFFELIEYELDDITLMIYYLEFHMFTTTRVTVDCFINGFYDDKVVVTGEELAKHRDLLGQLANIELIPSNNRNWVDARIYYIFEHEKHGEIFSFLSFQSIEDAMINNQRVETNRVFYEVAIAFLPERAANRVQSRIDYFWPVCD